MEVLTAGLRRLTAEASRILPHTISPAPAAGTDAGGAPVWGTEHAASGGEPALRRAGDCWLVSYGGSSVYVRHTKGFLYLAQLLSSPNRDVHVLDLVGVVTRMGRAAPDAGLGPVIDPHVIRELRARRRALRDELAEAEQWNDRGRIEAIQAEIGQIEEYVRSSHGLGGRVRRGESATERARQAVQKGLATVERRLAACHPALAHHLQTCVRTGVLCSYLPGPGAAAWTVE